jgi:hypothetical protein
MNMKLKNVCEFSTFYAKNKSDIVLNNPVTETTILKVYTKCASLDVKKTIYKDNQKMSGIYR